MARLLALLGIALISAGCVAAAPGASNGSGGPGSPSAKPTTSPAARTYDVASGPGALILRMETGGGFVPPGYLLTELPAFSLYGDGRVVVPGPMILIYPGPLLPNLREMRISKAEIQRLLAAADEAGLLGPDAQYDAVGIMDAGTTVFTTVVAGKRHRISAYALFEGQRSESAATDAARARLAHFRDQLGNLPALLGRQVTDEVAYEAQAVRVFTSVASDEEPQGLKRQVVKWPLAADPSVAGVPATSPGYRCLVLSGAKLDRFMTVAKTANSLTVWTFGAARYAVAVRPLLPDETGCGATPQ